VLSVGNFAASLSFSSGHLQSSRGSTDAVVVAADALTGSFRHSATPWRSKPGNRGGEIAFVAALDSLSTYASPQAIARVYGPLSLLVPATCSRRQPWAPPSHAASTLQAPGSLLLAGEMRSPAMHVEL
jgi:hypothetical protein